MRLIVGDIGGIEERLGKLASRENFRRVVEAGSAAAIRFMQERTSAARHVVTGEMQAAFGPGIYHEDIDRCWQDVYPQGLDARGVSNAKKAYVINYGYGGRKTKKTGDKFITGKKKELEDVVTEAMTAEMNRIIEQTTR